MSLINESSEFNNLMWNLTTIIEEKSRNIENVNRKCSYLISLLKSIDIDEYDNNSNNPSVIKQDSSTTGKTHQTTILAINEIRNEVGPTEIKTSTQVDELEVIVKATVIEVISNNAGTLLYEVQTGTRRRTEVTLEQLQLEQQQSKEVTSSNSGENSNSSNDDSDSNTDEFLPINNIDDKTTQYEE